MNKTQWLRKQIEALTQTFPRRNMLAARREPWERRCVLLLCFCWGCGAGNCCRAASCCGASRDRWGHRRCWWHSLCTSLVGLELQLGCRDSAFWDTVLLPFMFFHFLHYSRNCCHGQSHWGSLSWGLGPPVLTLWPAGSLHFGSTGPPSPRSLGNTSRARAGEHAQAGQTPSSSPVR